MNRPRLALILGLIALTAVVRIAPHPFNFTPAGALGLFAGAHLRDRRLAYAAPLIAMFLGDLVVGFHIVMPVVYACFAAIVWIGQEIRDRRTLRNVAVAALASSVLFFLVTNFAWWALGGAYPKNLAGLIACLVAGIPYFRNTLASDALYAAILFCGMALAERRFPSLTEIPIRNEH